VSVALGWASPAHAAELSLAGPAGCSDRDELGFRVERALGSSLAQAPALELDVTIDEGRPGLTARVRVREAPASEWSERRLEAADCARLMDSLSVVIVLAIDQVRDARAQTQPHTALDREAPVAVVATDDASTSVSDTDTDADAAAPPSLRPAVLAWLVGDIGSLPDPALGVGLGVTLDARRVRLLASGLYFFEQHVELEGQGTPPPGADLALALAALSACYAPGGSWQGDNVLGLCVRAEAGRVFGRGTGVRNERTGGRLWLAPGLNVEGAWRVLGPALHLTAEAGAVLPLVRSEFRLGTLGELYRPAAVSVRAGLGLELVLE
jgi:hypothetical protein